MSLATLTRIAPILAPVRQLVRNLPVRRPSLNVTTGRVEDITSPATKAALEVIEQKLARPSKRTYYLGENGRVSQRPKLVGKIIAFTRATNTTEAAIAFTAELLKGACYATSIKAPVHIGSVVEPAAKPVEKKCDRITRENSGFASFDELLHAKGSYRPSLDVRVPELEWLADLYDGVMEQAGDPRRAYRYGTTKPKPVLDSRGREIPSCWLNLSPDSVQTAPSRPEFVR